MSFIKTASVALVAATIAFGAIAPISTTAFATDQGVGVAPVKKLKKSQGKFSLANFTSGKSGKKDKTAKYLAIGAAVGLAGYALIQSAFNDRRN